VYSGVQGTKDRVDQNRHFGLKPMQLRSPSAIHNGDEQMTTHAANRNREVAFRRGA